MAETGTLVPSEVFEARRKTAYVGKEVDWALRFADGHEEPSGYARVLFRSRPNELSYVAVTVPRVDYPWLAGMRRGEPVQVHGCITEIGSRSIELTGVTLMPLVEAAH